LSDLTVNTKVPVKCQWQGGLI